MGKRNISQESVKTSKKIVENKKKQQLNSLIKVLRPKVYITDSSSFKRLVQELTGNNNNSNTSLSNDDDHSPEIVRNVPVFEEMISDEGSPEQSGKESSLDSLGFGTDIGYDQDVVTTGDFYDDPLFLEDQFLVVDQQYCYPSCGGYSEQEVSLFELDFSAGII